MRKLSGLLGLFILLGCQTKPTVVSETYPVLIRSDKEAIKRVMRGEYSFVDVRSPLEVQSKSHPGSVPVWWEDETFRKDNGLRFFDDSQKIANRWALKGIAPNKPVIMVMNSETDAGFVKARCLMRSFGFQEIYAVNIRDIRSLNMIQETQIQEVPSWKAENLELSACLKSP